MTPRELVDLHAERLEQMGVEGAGDLERDAGVAGGRLLGLDDARRASRTSTRPSNSASRWSTTGAVSLWRMK